MTSLESIEVMDQVGLCHHLASLNITFQLLSMLGLLQAGLPLEVLKRPDPMKLQELLLLYACLYKDLFYISLNPQLFT